MLVEGDEIKHLRKAFSANGNIFLCVCVCVCFCAFRRKGLWEQSFLFTTRALTG